MKLLLGQNISFRVVKKISSHFPEASQVRLLGLENYPDRKIWEFAKANGYVVVTFDADFCDLAKLYGSPPKIVWLRTGNTTSDYIARLLLIRADVIQEFVENPKYLGIACLELDHFTKKL